MDRGGTLDGTIDAPTASARRSILRVVGPVLLQCRVALAQSMGGGRQFYYSHPSNRIHLRDLDVVIWRLSKSRRLDIVSGVFLRAIKV